MNMTRSIFKTIRLSNDFLGEAIAFLVYVLNKYPIKSVKKNVTQEAWTSMSCCVAHFIVSGFVAYAYVPKEFKKLYERSEKCIFLGYNDQSKAFKLYNQVTKKVIINKYVEFKEDEAWDGSIDKKIFIGVVIPQEEDEAEERIAKGGQQGLQTQSPIIYTPKITPRIFFQGESSILVAQSTPPLLFDSTILSLRSRNTRILREIYEVLYVHSNFVLFDFQTTFFEEDIKEEK
jgi:hypothetical protein